MGFCTRGPKQVLQTSAMLGPEWFKSVLLRRGQNVRILRAHIEGHPYQGTVVLDEGTRGEMKDEGKKVGRGKEEGKEKRKERRRGRWKRSHGQAGSQIVIQESGSAFLTTHFCDNQHRVPTN